METKRATPRLPYYEYEAPRSSERNRFSDHRIGAFRQAELG